MLAGCVFLLTAIVAMPTGDSSGWLAQLEPAQLENASPSSPPSISPPVASPPSPSLSPPVASCPAGTSNFPVQLFTQNWGSEISFKIDGVTITSGTLGNFQTYTYMRCLAPGSHTLLLQDSFGDGWHGGYVRINNVNYGTTFTSGYSMTATFYIGPAPPPPPACNVFPVRLWTRNCGSEISFKIDGVTITDTSGTLGNFTTYTYMRCLAPGSHELILQDSKGDGWHGGFVRINNFDYGTTFTSGDSMTATFYIGPAPPPSPVASCPAGTSNFPVQLFTQNWGSEISFKIDGVTITSGTLGNFQTYTYMRCLAPGSHTLLLQDPFGNRWHVGYLTYYVRINNLDYWCDGYSRTATFYIGPALPCPAGTSNVPVQLFTTIWGSQISFKIDGVNITSGTLGSLQMHTYMRCLAPGSHTLLLQDSFGDGWHGGYVRINNVNYGTTFTSGASMTATFNV